MRRRDGARAGVPPDAAEAEGGGERGRVGERGGERGTEGARVSHVGFYMFFVPFLSGIERFVSF